VANKYVWSGAAGAGTGADWANAYLTIKAAAEAAGTAAGDSIWAAHDHAETTAAVMTISPKNTKAAPGTIACVNRAGSVPPVAADLATTATVTSTGASGLNIGGVADGPTLWQGITFSCGTGAVNSGIVVGTANGQINHFKNCVFKKLGSIANVNAIGFGAKVSLDNCSMQFGSTGDLLAVNSMPFEWINSPNGIIGATFPLILLTSSALGSFLIRGVDLSAIAGTLVQVLTVSATHDIRLTNCRINAAATVSVAQSSPGGGRVSLINCDSGAINYRNERYMCGGSQVTETSIVHTGGASDGTTPVSWKIVTDANSRWQIPFESLPITVWSDTVGAKTVSIYGYWANASPPNNDDIWVEAEYLGSAASPQSSFATSGKASFLATNAAIPIDTSPWGTGVTTTRFKMSVPLTTAMKGPISVTVKAAKASSTFYIDPKVEIA
jgi:hypothetical protein